MHHKKYRTFIYMHVKACLLLMAVLLSAYCLQCQAKTDDSIQMQVSYETTEEIVIEPIETAKAAEPVEPEEVVEETYLFYDVPLGRDLQRYIASLCEGENIDPAVVLAIIDTESGYDANALGDKGRSFGLMQVQARWHVERMDRLGCTDLLNPYENVAVGVDILSELITYYDGNIEMALVAYNAGQTGAYNNWFRRGVYSSEYSRKVLSESEVLTENSYTDTIGGESS